jgi:hypothetical protein
MSILDSIRRRHLRVVAPHPATLPVSWPHLAIDDYDRLDAAQVTVRLHHLSQAELASVDEYERAHRRRHEVLAELRRLRGAEPLPGYDSLDPEGISTALGLADLHTLALVCEYEMKLHRRVAVLDELARLRRERQAGDAA